MNYLLIATNSQGATIRFTGDTLKSVRNQFLSEYEKKGWEIQIFDNITGDRHVRTTS